MWYLSWKYALGKSPNLGTPSWKLVQSSCFGALLTVLCWSLAELGLAEKGLAELGNLFACLYLPDVLAWDFVTQSHTMSCHFWGFASGPGTRIIL